MKKGTINVRDITLVSRGQPNIGAFQKPVFVTVGGDDVYRGDAVVFSVPGSIFNSYGTVSNYNENGLKIDVFNQLLNKWEYYKVALCNSFMS